MAIGTTAALLGSAVIGAGASIIGSSANSRAINSATDAQVQANRDSLALQEDIYNRNNALLSPYSQRGNVAGDTYNALLGLPVASAAPTGNAGSIDWGAYVNGNPDALANWNVVRGTQADTFGGNINRFGAYHYNADGARRDLSPFSTSATMATGVTPVTAQNALDSYLNSAGYKFQLGEANKNATAQFNAAGAMDSGAAVKAAQDRAQNISTNFFNNYLGLLGNQQGVGLSAASAVAGVGQNYANNATTINSNTANALSNAATAKAGNTNALLGNLSSSFGLGLGALGGFGKSGSPYGGTLGGIY